VQNRIDDDTAPFGRGIDNVRDGVVGFAVRIDRCGALGLADGISL
jgi:hypothetical protein